jgi:hypothetical protein
MTNRLESRELKAAVFLIVVLSVGVCCGDSNLSQAEQDAMLRAAMQRRSDAIERLDKIAGGRRRTSQSRTRTRNAETEVDRAIRDRRKLLCGSDFIFEPLPIPLFNATSGSLPEERVEFVTVVGGSNGAGLFIARFYNPASVSDATIVARALKSGHSSGFSQKHLTSRLLRVAGFDPLTGLMPVEPIDTAELERRYRDACVADARMPEFRQRRPENTEALLARMERVRKRYPNMLKNARNLIDVKLYAGAEKTLRQIILEAPQSQSAKEAQKMLDALPAH